MLGETPPQTLRKEIDLDKINSVKDCVSFVKIMYKKGGCQPRDGENQTDKGRNAGNGAPSVDRDENFPKEIDNGKDIDRYLNAVDGEQRILFIHTIHTGIFK
jgi:hypothetical protein